MVAAFATLLRTDGTDIGVAWAGEGHAAAASAPDQSPFTVLGCSLSGASFYAGSPWGATLIGSCPGQSGVFTITGQKRRGAQGDKQCDAPVVEALAIGTNKTGTIGAIE